MDVIAIVGMGLGLFGFIFGIGAWHKASRIEAELKRKRIIDEKFDSDQ